MKVKRVNRYYCEYCKKAGCAGGHMRKHEERCTLNPNRICGMCQLLGQNQSDINRIIKLLPNPEDYRNKTVEYDSFNGLEEAVAKILPKIREETGNCPACIMAVFRQGKIHVPTVKGFNFSDECKAIWADINEQNRQDNYYHY